MLNEQVFFQSPRLYPVAIERPDDYIKLLFRIILAGVRAYDFFFIVTLLWK